MGSQEPCRKCMKGLAGSEALRVRMARIRGWGVGRVSMWSRALAARLVRGSTGAAASEMQIGFRKPDLPGCTHSKISHLTCGAGSSSDLRRDAPLSFLNHSTSGKSTPGRNLRPRAKDGCSQINCICDVLEARFWTIEFDLLWKTFMPVMFPMPGAQSMQDLRNETCTPSCVRARPAVS